MSICFTSLTNIIPQFYRLCCVCRFSCFSFNILPFIVRNQFVFWKCVTVTWDMEWKCLTAPCEGERQNSSFNLRFVCKCLAVGSGKLYSDMCGDWRLLYIHTYIHTCTYIQTCIHTYIHIHIHMHKYIHTSTYTHTYKHTFIHSYIHNTHIHIHIHTSEG